MNGGSGMNISMNGKKPLFCILLLSLCVLTGCINKREVTQEESNEHFKVYIEEIKELIRESYEVEPTTENTSYGENKYVFTASLSYEFASNITLTVFFENSSGREEGGIEFSARKNEPFEDVYFDIDLALEVLSVFSGYEYEKNEVMEVMHDRDGVYSAQKYGFELTSDEYVENMYCFNFMEDWSMSYRIYEFIYPQNTEPIYYERLSIGGLTKTGMR